MAAGLSRVITCVLFVTLVQIVSGREDCNSYTDLSNVYHSKERCMFGFCCGSCYSRHCCFDSFRRLSEDAQEDCIESYGSSSSFATIASTSTVVVILIVMFISCCVCPCCCLYKMCRKPRPVIATTSHTTVVTNTAQHYPQQPTASTGGQAQSYQGGPFPGYQPVPVQPGYGPQPMPQAYGPQPVPQAYGPQPMPQGYGAPHPAPYPVYTPGPPPPYQEAIGPGYGPSAMAYSQAAFTPGQPSYPLQPPGQPEAQPKAPPPPMDHGQPAYNPAYAHPPPPHGGY